MIYSLRGKLIEKDSTSVVVECAGVGYYAKASYNTVSKIGDIGQEVFIYTYLNVYQDGLDLYAFYDNSELSIFKMLISISGVGPKAALSILSVFEPQQFIISATSGDVKKITSVKGIGKKMAERIVLELKDKLKKSELKPESVESTVFNSNDSELNDAISALELLGYNYEEISLYLPKIDSNSKSEDIIKQVLKNIGNNK